MSDVLIVYASTHGHTAKIAARVARSFEEKGVVALVHDIKRSAAVAPADYDGVVVGASVHRGEHQHEVVRWAKENAAALSAMPSAFFSVCLTAAEDTTESRRATGAYVEDLIDATGWTPGLTASFAGALQYREYDFMTRLLMRLLMRHGGHPTDASRDYDYTDWEAVDRFAHDCAGVLSTTRD